MVDERNKRGRPPKKPKPPEVEQREKQLLQQKIMLQVQQGFTQQALADGLNLNITTSMQEIKSGDKQQAESDNQPLKPETEAELYQTPEKT